MSISSTVSLLYFKNKSNVRSILHFIPYKKKFKLSGVSVRKKSQSVYLGGLILDLLHFLAVWNRLARINFG